MTPTQKKIVVTLGFCGLVSAADNWFVSPALPAIAQTLAVAPAAAAIILTAYLTPYGLLQPICGAIGDAVGRVRLLCIIVAGLAVSTVLCAAAPTLEALVAARIVTGCFAAGIISVNQSLVGSVVSEEDRQGAVGLLMGVTFTGQGLSAGLGGLICDLVGWRAAFICFGVLGAAAWLGVRRLRYLDEMDGTSAIDAAGAGVSAAGAGAVGSAEREPFRPAAFLRHAAQILFGPGRAIYFVAFTTGIIFLGVYGFMGTFLAERCGLSSTQAGLLMMFYGLACLAGGSISGRIGEARGQRGVIAVGETSGVIATALLAASTITGSWMPALPAAACLGLGYILVQPTLVSFSMDIDPSHTGLCTG
ncbi:MFS transporter, partial [Parolsenella catena]|uniref:MFS transporter n=1 Tax=Parolsenella catena TaxID=2003188 RepID=UPI003A957255